MTSCDASADAHRARQARYIARKKARFSVEMEAAKRELARVSEERDAYYHEMQRLGFEFWDAMKAAGKLKKRVKELEAELASEKNRKKGFFA